MPTPHNTAQIEAIAKTVLMPGDPLRAKYVAEHFLTNPVLVNNVRGVQGYTGTWKGVRVTVMASGMGIPSIGIYSWELFNFYNVENIIRIGSAGGLQDDVELMDVLIAQGACTDSAYINNFAPGGTFAPIGSYELLRLAVAAAEANGARVRVGNLLSSDQFYHPDGASMNDVWKKMGVLGIEMECAGLYANAAYAGKRALGICTVSDHLYKPEELSPEERQTGFDQMITIALDTAVAAESL